LKKINDIGYYFITNSSLSRRGISVDVKDAVKAGCKYVQYREKEKCVKEMITEAEMLRNICRGKTMLLINDHVDVALAIDADGVHLGQDDLPVEKARCLLGEDKIIGVTIRSIDQAIQGESQGADYLGVGPIFSSSTKKDSVSPVGISFLKEVRKLCSLPLVAIGGITPYTVREICNAGADGVAAISSVLSSDDVYENMVRFQSLLKEERLV
jgi:thiamine-phosphate pyrophosphorylase